MTRVLSCDDAKLIVEGHSDATGSNANNLELSWQRAEAVIAALTDEGFAANRFEPMGFGARFSLGDATTPIEDDPSRRVAFRIAQQQ